MVAMLACLAGLTSVSMSPPQALKVDPRMDWWREARFGMFIHWGLYSVLAGEWNGNKGHAEWIRETAHIPIPEYEKLLDRFNPVKFNADAWVKMAKDAGMKYIVITSKHHDGFCLFDSKYTEWDVMSTPFKRDIMQELSDACRKQGIVFCTYHSIMDWHHQDYLPKRGWEGETWRGAKVSAPDLAAYKPDFDKFNTYLSAQVAEVITKYKPAVMWFDGEWESTWNHALGKPLYDLCLATDPKIIVNNRVDVYRAGMEGMTSSKDAAGDFGTPEQQIPATGLPGVDWETCMTMNDHWGFNAVDKNFKTTRSMIRMISDVASKGGNYLLNIGPRADGTVPPESVQRLKEIGVWMRANGKAVYGTQASPFKSLPWGRATMKPLGKNTTLFLHVFDWPKDGKLVVSGLGSKARGAQVLGSCGVLRLQQADGALTIDLPKTMPNADCTVVEVQIVGRPIVYSEPVIEAPADQFVISVPVSFSGASGLEVRYTLDGSAPSVKSPLARGPVAVSKTATLKARAFHQGRPVTGVVSRSFRKVVPLPASTVAGAIPGLGVATYAGNWDKVPNFDALTAESRRVANAIGLGANAKREHFGLVFTGYVRVPADEAYAFALACDDGGKLWVDGQLVVDNDGLHSPDAKQGVIALAKGLHKIRVEYFNKTGGSELIVRFARAGAPLQAIAAGDLIHN